MTACFWLTSFSCSLPLLYVVKQHAERRLPVWTQRWTLFLGLELCKIALFLTLLQMLNSRIKTRSCRCLCSFIKHFDLCCTPKYVFVLFFHLEDSALSHPFPCFSLRQVNLSQNQLTSLPSGLLHLTHIQRISAAKNQLTVLFDIPDGMFRLSQVR